MTPWVSSPVQRGSSEKEKRKRKRKRKKKKEKRKGKRKERKRGRKDRGVRRDQVAKLPKPDL